VAAFCVFVAGGYALHWGWTGFQGNTLWDWVQLLLAPILFGIVVVPAISAWMAAEIVQHEERVAERKHEREEEREAEHEADAAEHPDATVGSPPA
jgi:TRAP-type C4-dicarboxylate transport system permease small subunit